jgi:DNA repair protein RadC
MNIGKIYPVEKEIVVIGAVKKRAKKQPKKVPHIKVRVSRGKGYDPKKVITGPDDTVKYFRQYLNNYNIEGQEQFLVMYLTRNNAIIGIYPHSKGGMTSTIADVKIIVATALSLATESVITCHNHPSGNLEASPGDLALVKKLGEALKFHEINLLDNIILTKTSYKSF